MMLCFLLLNDILTETHIHAHARAYRMYTFTVLHQVAGQRALFSSPMENMTA